MSLLSVTLQRRDPPLGVVALHGEHDALLVTRLENELAVLLDGGFGDRRRPARRDLHRLDRR